MGMPYIMEMLMIMLHSFVILTFPHLLPTPIGVESEFAFAAKALYEMSWTGPMLFSMDCSM